MLCEASKASNGHETAYFGGVFPLLLLSYYLFSLLFDDAKHTLDESSQIMVYLGTKIFFER